MSVRQKALYLSLFVIAGFALSVGYHVYAARVQGLNYYPYNTFLFRPDDRFGDFFDNFNAGALPYMEIKASRAMFPFFMLFCRGLFFIQHRFVALAFFLGTFLTLLGFAIWMHVPGQPARIRLTLVCALLFCSYPVLISLDRANFENLCFLLILAALLCQQKRHYLSEAILFGVALAIKPYSIFLLPLLLLEGQYLATAVALAVAGVLTALSLVVLTPDPLGSIEVLRANLGLYNNVYVLGNEGLYFGDSLFGLIKAATFLVGDHWKLFPNAHLVMQFTRSLMTPYLLITTATFLIVLSLLFICRTSLWKRTAILAACLNLFPYVGGAYRQLYFIVPLLMLIAESPGEIHDFRNLSLFGLILIPEGYVHFTLSNIYRLNPGELDASVILLPLLIGFLALVLLLETVARHDTNPAFLELRDILERRVPVLAPRKEIS